jgi:large subunit ribosomal protein L35
MPKMKTKRSAAKRYRITGTGKVKVARAGKSHILTKKNRKRKRNLRKGGILKDCDSPVVKRIMPYA